MKKKLFICMVINFLSMFQLNASEKNVIYDIHQHYVPECYKKALLSHSKAGVESDGLPTSNWSVENQLKMMDKMGIKVAFLSLATPHPHWNNAQETIKLIHKINDEGAKIVLKYPNRFRLFATLPLPYVKSSVEEIRHIYNDLKVVGVKLPTNVNGIYIGDKEFNPIFDELNKRNAIVFLHPVQFPNLPKSVVKKYPPAIAMYLQETTYAVLNLIYSGTLEKYPNIKFIIPHSGAFLTSLADRLEGFQQLAQAKSDYKLDDVKKYLNKFYYDLAGFPVPNQLYGLLNITDASHLLYGSDYPYAYPNFIETQKEKLDKTKLLTKKQRKKIYKDNFELLFDLD